MILFLELGDLGTRRTTLEKKKSQSLSENKFRGIGSRPFVENSSAGSMSAMNSDAKGQHNLKSFFRLFSLV